MHRKNYDIVAKFLWPAIVLAFSGLTFVYFVKEAPEQITTSIIPILVYFTLLLINKKLLGSSSPISRKISRNFY